MRNFNTQPLACPELESQATSQNVWTYANKIVSRIALSVCLAGGAGAATAGVYEVLVADNRAEATVPYTPECGEVILSGSDWLNGQGVDIHSNGAYQKTGTSCHNNDIPIFDLGANPPQNGFGWQCVELVNRLYESRGWSARITIGGNGAAKNLFTNAAEDRYPGLEAHANGTGYTPVPGDMIVHSNGTYGHVTVIDHIEGNTVHAVEQNNTDSNGNYTGRTSYVYDSNSGTVSKTGATISGFIHSEKNTSLSTNPANGQEVTNNTWVYTKAGGSYWPIKHKSSWTASDTAHWGNEPIVVSSQEISAHEAGYQDGVRYVGAHPPADGTTIYVDGGTGQQYYFIRGNAYPIDIGELADLGAVNQAIRIPATDSRLYDFTTRQLNLQNGEMYRFAGTPTVRQIIYVGGSALSYHINNDTVKDCLYLTQGRTPLILPQDAQWYMPVSDSGSNANCTYPPGMVLRGPGGMEQWRIEGNNPYIRRYYPSALLTYLHTSGSPNHQQLSSVASLNNLLQGTDMTTPEGLAFVDMGNGAEFIRQAGEWHYVPSPDMNTCLGIEPWEIVQVPSIAVGGLLQGSQAACQYSNRVVAHNGINYYIDNTGKSHPILNEAVKNCVIVRRGTGAVGNVNFNPTTQYPLGDAAYCPYETDPGLNSYKKAVTQWYGF